MDRRFRNVGLQHSSEAPDRPGAIGGEVRFKIELLSDHADEASVVQVSHGHTLERAKAEAIALQQGASDVDGFQIRDLDHSGRIVWSEKRYP